MSLETFNSQYLQRYSTSAPAILAAAKVSRKLDAPGEEVEAVVFAALEESVDLDIKACVFSSSL
jgi:peptide alpha-N-acetyltransferase